ncbi:EndoU domain-containing protein [Curvivirga aplysinae]|uniref:EndoU domain-containing protein n=1 Tax=Curvivirga aplysinae TaxID=2529852 RepID=UPI001C3F7EC8|nr:EndoU domain-containing protein [Curvivirga aplysinae]
MFTFLSIVSSVPTDSIMAGEALHSCEYEGLKTEHTIQVDWGHIFCGDVNRKKTKGTGYHHRPNGEDSNTAYIEDIDRKNSETGVYEASPLYVWEEGKWYIKRRGSTFFPDHCTAKQVMNSIAYAATNVHCRYKNGKWGGLSAPIRNEGNYCYGSNGDALIINGYFRRDNGHVATAWPLMSNQQPASCISIEHE